MAKIIYLKTQLWMQVPAQIDPFIIEIFPSALTSKLTTGLQTGAGYTAVAPGKCRFRGL
jgi:hypothetical protein